MMNGTTVYAECREDFASSAELLLTCITDRILQESENDKVGIARSREYARNLFVILAAALSFFMQAGFALICAGAVRKKNLQNTMLKNLLDACGASIAFYAVGYGFAYGDGIHPNGFVGTRNFFMYDVDDIAFWLFQYAFSAATATIVVGTLAERCQMTAYFCYSIVLSGFVYPIVVHAIWNRNGWLSVNNANPLFGVGVIDVAGSGVVHITGGLTALISTLIIGPRRGRFHDEKTGELLDSPKEINGHNIGLQLLGTLLLWFGWYGFNSGSTLFLKSSRSTHTIAALAAANTTLSAGSAGMVALFSNAWVQYQRKKEVKYDLIVAMNGVLGGLVAISASCAVVETWGALLIGTVAGTLYILSSWALIQLRLDDAVDAIPVHLTNGIWGIMAVAFFASSDRLDEAYGYGRHSGSFMVQGERLVLRLLATQLIGILFICGWTICTMYPFFRFLQWKGSLRVTAIDEVLGLDQAYFGGSCSEETFTKEQIEALTKEMEIQLEEQLASFRSDEKYRFHKGE